MIISDKKRIIEITDTKETEKFFNNAITYIGWCDTTNSFICYVTTNQLNKFNAVNEIKVDENETWGKSMEGESDMKKNKKYGIQITYSWGDEEPIENYGTYNSKEDAFEQACILAAKEAYVQNEEFIQEHDYCIVTFVATEYAIDLYYAYDDEYCYYRIVEIDE